MSDPVCEDMDSSLMTYSCRRDLDATQKQQALLFTSGKRLSPSSRSPNRRRRRPKAHFIDDTGQPLHAEVRVEEGGNQIATKCFGTSVNHHTIWGEYRNRFVNSCPPLLMVIASFLPSSYPLVLSQRI